MKEFRITVVPSAETTLVEVDRAAQHAIDLAKRQVAGGDVGGHHEPIPGPDWFRTGCRSRVIARAASSPSQSIPPQ
jgi:hypothetical protein